MRGVRGGWEGFGGGKGRVRLNKSHSIIQIQCVTDAQNKPLCVVMTSSRDMNRNMRNLYSFMHT